MDGAGDAAAAGGPEDVQGRLEQDRQHEPPGAGDVQPAGAAVAGHRAALAGPGPASSRAAPTAAKRRTRAASSIITRRCWWPTSTPTLTPMLKRTSPARSASLAMSPPTRCANERRTLERNGSIFTFLLLVFLMARGAL